MAYKLYDDYNHRDIHCCMQIKSHVFSSFHYKFFIPELVFSESIHSFEHKNNDTIDQ